MRTLFLILTLSYILINSCFAQTSVWKVEGKGNTLYIGGTIHVLSVKDYPLPAEFDSAYKKAESIVFETNVKEMETPEMIQKMMSMAIYQDDRTLKSVLSKEVYNLLESECSKQNLTLKDFSKFKPSMVLLMYTVTKMQNSGDSVAGVDSYYLTKAITDNKSLLYLETVESQLELLFGEESENDDQAVIQFFDNLNEFDNSEVDLKEDWLSGKDKIFRKIQKDMKKEYPDIYKQILLDRNTNWIPIIESYLDDKAIEFVLVGVLHLSGNNGILNMLKRKGYKISQL